MKNNLIKIRDIAGDHLPNPSVESVRFNEKDLSAEPLAGITEAKVISQWQMLQSGANKMAQATLFGYGLKG
jgi:hypothetical protein